MAGNEHHHLLRGGGGRLPQARGGKLRQHGLIGNVVKRIKLHIRAAGRKLGKPQAFAHGVGVYRRAGITAHGAAVLQKVA